MDLGPLGYKAHEEEYEYERLKKREPRLTQSRMPFVEDEPIKEIVKEVKLKARQAAPFLEGDDLEPLRRTTPEIVGGLFDRVQFLRERIDEIQKSIQVREELHGSMVEEIGADIKEKTSIAERLADMDEKRNFMLDISLLRRENRAENVRFWKDMVELKTELRELLEAYQTEVKIASLFGKEKAGEGD
ncbi:MAG: hypothetical protein ACE5FW_01855 [Candidatus Aenigmatarchaeota archaeon]